MVSVYHLLLQMRHNGAREPIYRHDSVSQNTENVDITTEIRPDTRKFSFGIAPLESALCAMTLLSDLAWEN